MIQRTIKFAISHYTFGKDIPSDLPKENTNLFMAINQTLDNTLQEDKT